MTKKIFIFSFVAACIVQGFIFTKLDTTDFSMWAKQAEYVQTNNPAQFDYLLAYGHPGGPIIETTIFFHYVFGLSYDNSLLIFIIIFDGLAIAGTCVMCYVLSKNNLWWPIVLIGLSANWLYISSTPPSTTISLVISFLCLFSLYLYEKEKNGFYALAFWSILAGLIISIRIDIGAVIALAFFIFLKPKISWRQAFYVMLGVMASFVLFDPFMWFMPIQHMGDLLFEMLYHYQYFTPTRLGFFYVLAISSFTFVSMFFSIMFMLMKKIDISKSREARPLLPNRFSYVLLITTVVLYIIFLTARCQAPRYFLPLISIWQMLLPLFIFSLTANLKPAFSKAANIFFTIALILYPIISLVF
jgi:hypothetical protein